MKKILYTTLVLIVIPCVSFISSCKKTASVDGHVLTHSITITNNGVVTNSSTTYQYDGQGRQILATPATGSATSTSYNGSTVTQITGTSTVVYTLNSNGLAESDNQGNQYSYTNGFLSSETNGTANSLTNQISGGNIITTTVVSSGVTTTFGYSFLTTVDYRNFGISFLGSRNTDLESTETVSGGTSGQGNFTYQYDSHGRVIQMTFTAGGTYTEAHTYQYTTN